MQLCLNTRVNKALVAEQLQTMSLAQVGGLVTADELTDSLIKRCIDWTPADFEDAKLLVNDYLYALQNDGLSVRVNRGIWKATSTPAAGATLVGTARVSVLTEQDFINPQAANIQSEATMRGSATSVVTAIPTPRRRDRGDQDQQERLSQQQKRRSSSGDRGRRRQMDKIIRCCLCREKIENSGQPITCGQLSLAQLLDKLTQVRPEISSQIDNIRSELMVSETKIDQQSQTTDRTRHSRRQSQKGIVCYLCKREIENPGQPISCGQFSLKQLLDKVTELQPGMSSQITSQLAPVAEHAESKSSRVARQFEQQVTVSSQQWSAESMLSGPVIQQLHEKPSGGQCRCSFCHQTVQDKDAITCGTNNFEQLLRMLSEALDAEAMAAGGQLCTHRTPGTP